jgi:ubiquinone/menaquinone biosynthesis C-methylase UbiE
LGWLIAKVMAVETAPANMYALDLLQLQATDRVLDAGCGHGRTVERAASMVAEGFVAGVDLSERMVCMARRRNRRHIEERRVEIKQGDSARIPYPERSFDKVCSVHTLYFWPDPLRHLGEIHRVMKPGGRFVLGFGPKEDEQAASQFPSSVYRFYSSEEVCSLLRQVGFTEIETTAARVGSRDIVFATARAGTASK